MPQLVYSLLLALVAVSAQATVSYSELREVGDQVKCQCSSGCSYTVGSCNMLGCHFREPVLKDIQNGLEENKPREEILAAVYTKYGDQTRVEPRREGFGMVGWIMPFAALLLGLSMIPLVIRNWRKRTVVDRCTDTVTKEVYDRYRDSIEEDLKEME